jgi:hypothetical protein
VRYHISGQDVMHAIDRNPLYQPVPDPPFLALSTNSSLTVAWMLPEPPGIARYVEIQYRPASSAVDGPAKNWAALANKSLGCVNFSSCVVCDLPPGAKYTFRLRYHNHRGWTEFSESSLEYATLPSRPSAPKPPVCMAAMPHAVSLRWSAPISDGGSLIRRYELRGRSVGDNDFKLLYSGPSTTYTVFNLFPQFAYNFFVVAVNAVSASDPSAVFSMQTPPALFGVQSTLLHQEDWRLASWHNNNEDGDPIGQIEEAMSCSDAWRQYWDPDTNQMFYFNVLTGFRQIAVPDALQPAHLSAQVGTSATHAGTSGGSAVVDSTDKEKSKDLIEFRLKRLKIMKSLRQQYNIPQHSPHAVTINRSTLLLDAINALSNLPLSDLRNRLKIEFQDEAGIDAGGLLKEFYFVLFQDLQLLLGPRHMNLIRQTESGKLFFSESHLYGPDNAPEEAISGGMSNRQLNHTVLTILQQMDAGSLMKFTGRMVGKAFFDGLMINFPICNVLLKHIVSGNLQDRLKGKKIHNKIMDILLLFESRVDDSVDMIFYDLLDIDAQLFQSLAWMKNNNIRGVIDDYTFTVARVCNDQGLTEQVNLCREGDRRIVTEENKLEYISLVADWKTTFGVEQTLLPFLQVIRQYIDC